MAGITFGSKALRYALRVRLPARLPRGVEVLTPSLDARTKRLIESFFSTYFSDKRHRIFIFGINPGRYSGGLTGVAFTDPFALQILCGIPNELPKRRELSSEFIYDVIQKWGGVRSFYRDFFLTAVCPLGFTKDRKNFNFYDDQDFTDRLRPFLSKSILTQLGFGARRDVAIVLGTGKLRKFFSEMNEEHGFFKKVHFLEHPRWIMQYQRKKKEKYMEKYVKTFSDVLSLKISPETA
jgi:hypothetical protein